MGKSRCGGGNLKSRTASGPIGENGQMTSSTGIVTLTVGDYKGFCFYPSLWVGSVARVHWLNAAKTR